MKAPFAPQSHVVGHVVCVGVATLDAIAAVPRFPQPDCRVQANEVAYAGGGPAATAAVACCRLGVPARFVGAVAADWLGDAILSGLREEGVDVSAVIRVAGRSGGSVIVVDAARGTRAICNQPGPRLSIPPGSAAAAAIAGADWLHVDQLGWPAVRGLARGKLSIDGGNPIPELSLADTALFAPTLEQLRALFGERPTPALLRAALDAGAACVVATDGANGSVVAMGHGPAAGSASYEAWRVPALAVPLRSTLGAGDVFHGALLAATARGVALPARVAYANVAAALSCRGLDGRSAIPRHDDVMALLPRLDPVPLELPP